MFMKHWRLTNKGDWRAAAIADDHYSRRTPGSPQFMPPGETIVLISYEADAIWGWWRPHPRSGIKSMNGLDGWTCTIFRNTGSILSSELVLDAEGCLEDRPPGPDGLITYVWDSKVRSTNPGYCFKRAGYVVTGRSADKRKTLLQKRPWPNRMTGHFETTGGNQSGLPTDGDALRERTDGHYAGTDLRGGSGVDTRSLEVGGEKRRED